MSQSEVLSQLENGVLTLQLNRPEKKNATTDSMYAALAEGLEMANQNDSVRVVKIIGNAQSFCAGNDLKDFLENPPTQEGSSVWRFLFSLANCDKPMIAGVNGAAVGIGTTLLLHCDLVVASQSAVFALPFTALGLCPEAGSSLLLPMQAGVKKANQWLLLGERFNAHQAESAGVINCVVETSDEVSLQLDKWTQQLLKLPFDALQTSRRLMKSHYHQQVVAQIKKEGDDFNRLLVSEDAQNAFKAFLNR